MYKIYIVPDATGLTSHAAIYENMQLLWDPLAESDAYAVTDISLKDELNKASSLEFTVLPANIHYGDFHKRRTVVVLYDDEDWLFEGVVTDAPLDFFKRRKVTCSGPMAFLCDSIQAPDEKNKTEAARSGSEARYAKVPDVWYTAANPKSLSWYERSITTSDSGDEQIKYTKTKDTSANADKTYYYKITSASENENGENLSGATITVAAATKETVVAHITRLLDVHNAQTSKFKQIHPGTMYSDSDTDTHEFKSANYRTTWDALKSDILDDYGKYFRIRLGSDHELYLDYLELNQLPSVPDSIAPLIEFTNNMVNMNESDDSDDDIFTVLVPIGKNNLTVADVTGHDSPTNPSATRDVDPYIVSLGGNKRYVVVSQKALARYGYVIKMQSFSDVSNAETLWEKAKKYIENNYDDHTEYEVKAVDIRFISGSGHRIAVGDKVHLRSQWHGIDTTDLYVISAEHDLVNPENDSYRIGIPTSDREANNRTLTGQTNSAKSKQSKDNASTSSSVSRLNSILEEYIHVTEWGLEMSTRLKNERESDDQKYMTRFLQDEEHINLAAQKLFGFDGDGVGDLDAGYVAVLKSEYTDSKGAPKDPTKELWYEKVDGKYKLSKDTAATSDKQYYVQRLWTRYSEIDVGPGGIKARVDGNYATSTYCSSWIEMNEDSILALTGHLYVDEDGHVKVTSGAGMRTDRQEDNTTPTWIQVARTMYNKNPKTQNWYERKLDSSGAWLGDGKEDKATNDAYYTASTDTEADYSKYYYYKSNVRETFLAEYGVYDQGNLTAGVVAQMVNHPTYQKVKQTEVNNLKISGGSPNAKGWYEYDASKGTYGITLDIEAHINKDYYTVTNQTQTYTDIRGDHIVIGPATTPSNDMSDIELMKESFDHRIARYIDNKHLNGTITEIASDVVKVNALFAQYIETDEITVGSWISADSCHFGSVTVDKNVIINDEEDIGALEVHGTVEFNDDLSLYGTGYIQTLGIGSGDPDGGDVVYFDTDPGSTHNNAADIVMEFDTPTYSGDDVTIRYRTAGMTDFNNNTAITFTKPASIGRAVWSSGKFELYTVGGWAANPKWKMYTANVDIPTIYQGTTRDGSQNVLAYDRNGSNLTTSILLSNKPVLRARMEITGEDSDRFGNAVAFPHDASEDAPLISAWTKDIFLDATLPYDDGWGHAAIQMDFPAAMQALGERTEMTISYPGATPSDGQRSTILKLLDADAKGPSGYVRVYRDYIDNDYRGALIGAINVGDWYSQGESDAKGRFGLVGPIEAYTDGTQEEAIAISNPTMLEYSKTYMVYKTYEGVILGQKTFFRTPGMPSVRTWSDVGKTDNESIALGYSGSTKVYAQYGTDSESYVSLDGIIITSPSVGSVKTYYERWNGDDWVGNSITGDSSIDLGYSETITVKGRHEDGLGTWHEAPLLTVTSPADRYNDGYDIAVGTLAIDPSSNKELGYSDSVTVTAKVTKRDGTTSEKSISVTSPAIGETKTYYERLNSDDDWEGNSITADTTVTLDYSESIKVEGRHQDGLNAWHEGFVLTVKSKADRYNTGWDKGYDDAVDTLAISPSSDKALDFSGSVTVKAKVKKRDGTYSEKSITVTAPAEPASQTFSISSVQEATAPDGVVPKALSYGKTYEVHKIVDGSDAGGAVYFTAPASVSHSVSCTADTDTTHSYTEKGNDYTQLFTDVTFENQKWYRFTVTAKCGNDTLTRKFAIYVKTS